MNPLVLNSHKLTEYLDLNALRDAMKAALISSSLGETQHFLRNVTPLGSGNALGMMPAVNHSRQLLGYKAVSVFPSNTAHGLNPHQGLMVLLDYHTGEVKALMDGSTITALRTAAVSALATDLLSRHDSKILAVIGSGRQAYEHVRALIKVRSIQEVRIFNRNLEKAKTLIQRLSHEEKECTILYTATETIANTIKNADIVVTCTPSQEAFLNTNDLHVGTHVNAVGACRPGFREIEVHCHPNLKIFLDNHDACSVEADEIFRPQNNQNLSDCIVGELGDVLTGHKMGRESKHEITFFKSVGLAVEDLFAADLAYRTGNAHA